MSDKDSASFGGDLKPKLVDVAEESGREGPKCVSEFDEFRDWVNPSTADYRDWMSDIGGFGAETGKFPPAMWYSMERKRFSEDFDANGADGDVTVAEIGPFLDIWGASWKWCILDKCGRERDVLAVDEGPIRRSGAEMRRPMGNLVFSTTNTHVPLVFSEELRSWSRENCPGGIFRRAYEVSWPGEIPDIGADEGDSKGCMG